MIDTHLHSKFSGDSDVEPPLIIKKAKELGLRGITYTDHMDIDAVFDADLFFLDLPAYSIAIKELIESESSSDFYIGMGIELGLQPHLVNAYKEITDNYDFDFCIGAIHGIDGIDPYYDEFFDGYDISHRFDQYFEYTLKNINIFNDFDSLAHLDYIVRYANDYCLRKGIATVEPQSHEIIEEILKIVIKKGKSLEVNTGAFRAGLNTPNPSYEIIKRYYELGGRMITVGSDAHRLEHVGLKFKETKDRLKEIGFKNQIIYKKRTPIEIPLS